MEGREKPAPGVARRVVLRGGAVAAAAVWMAPVVTSFEPAAALGSPPPTSSSGPPPPTVVEMDVTITGSFTFSVTVPPTLPVVFTYQGVVDIDGFGTGTFTLVDTSSGASDPPSGDVVVDFGNATLTGQFVTGWFVNTQTQPVTLSITGGTGAFAGARGDATGTVATVGPISDHLDLSGSLTGTLEVLA
jgi:hypothetical protein